MHILIVDDLAINRNILATMLQSQGHTVAEAENGLVAIDKAQQSLFDIVLLDVMMPIKNGIETAPELKKIAGDRFLPIIFLTSLDDQQSTLDCLAAGGDDFLSKPYDMAILSAKIKVLQRTIELSEKTRSQNRQLSQYRKQVERDHAIVEKVFANLYQQNRYYPDVVNFTLQAASSFNGDLILADIAPNGHQYLLIGDFTGHGLAAAIGILPVAQCFFDATSKAESVAKIAATLNRRLLELLPNDRFCAATIIELAAGSGNLTLWSGGMPNAIIYHTQQQKTDKIVAQHMSLGILPEHSFDASVQNFVTNSDHTITFYTDGLIERAHSEQLFFADEHLAKIIVEQPTMGPQDIIEKMQHNFPNQMSCDDISVLQINPALMSNKKKYGDTAISVNFTIEVSFNEADMRQTHPIDFLLEQICRTPELQNERSIIYTILIETYNNALEHGILKLNSELKNEADGLLYYYQQREQRLANLSSAYVNYVIRYQADQKQLFITVKDSGTGFDLPKNLADLNNQDCFGWGLKLIESLCASCTINKEDHSLNLIYQIQ
ncbi:SpoIIE family protein phosphatase [Gayadomonas joobiniege]|uniref:SpoIIE family protein phosphatase n=1 Tax=Gayadomonas joobiniege TaxID=1234606 RepID=UPI0003695F4B|nr:SpoIIE family protein phosphatase [Gayadomonas joobiniege]